MSHPANDIWREALKEWRDEMNDKKPPVECQACGEISLRHIGTTVNEPRIESWECECGHVECFLARRKVAQVTDRRDLKQYYHCPVCGTRLDLDEVFQIEESKRQWAQQAWDEEDILEDLERYG